MLSNKRRADAADMPYLFIQYHIIYQTYIQSDVYIIQVFPMVHTHVCEDLSLLQSHVLLLVSV